ncbi:RYamide receptor-like [Actinia tenebrosa]|uniref:RYamide receptor-like n=1 Tax=Actinia tenebrosa TaxID=6105 RepID=A0A6P8H6Z3_ACTTE|nr:RYamide receptor-like [Actinia tenebrosa]XP_031552164.1 RYamide receptor-like [Actinia tenebrosa]
MDKAFQNQTNVSLHSDFVDQNDESVESKIAKAVAFGIVFLVAVLGNFLVIVAVIQNQRIHTVINYLIVNMAIADLLYIIMVMPPMYIEIFNYYDWAMGTYARGVYFCKVVHFCHYLFVVVSVLTLAAIAVDRFCAIVLPLKRIVTKQVFYVIIPVIWLVASGMAAPVFYAQKIIENSKGFLSCEEDWSPAFETRKASRVYSAMLFAIAYCVPFLAITIMYTMICRKLWMRKIPGERDAKSRKGIVESRKKVVKMLIAVVIAFVVCWLPVQVTTFMWEYKEHSLSIPPFVYFTCKFLMRAHASVSPCMYAAFNENYRTGFKKALTCCRKSKRDNYTNSRIHLHRKESGSETGGRRGTVVYFASRKYNHPYLV